MTPARHDGGFALLIVLWTLVLVSLLFIGMASSARLDAQLTANLRAAMEMEAAADGAIHTAIFDLMQNGGSTSSIAGPGIEVAVEIASQSGLLNPNVVSPELLRAMLVRLGTDQRQAGALADAIVDWRTPGRDPRPGGAKAPQYRAARLGYGPPGAPFETIGELGRVLGMTPTILDALTPFVTLYWPGDPEFGTAAPIVQAALRDLGIVRQASGAKAKVVQILATARRADGARAARRAIVRIGPSPNRRGWRILVWDSVPG